MRQYLLAIIIGTIFTGIISSEAGAVDKKLLVKGKWGTEANELGIRFPSPGVMPIAPDMCIGGFDVDDSGQIWISDSLNRKIKSYKDKEWRNFMVNCDTMGDLAYHAGKLFIVCKKPDGYLIFDTKKEKVENLIKVPFKNPGRIAILRKDLIAIEEISGGVWLIENGNAVMHPADALEAVGNKSFIYGMQKNLGSESYLVMKAELSKELQEPEAVLNLDQPEGKRVVFAKLAGMIDETPVVMMSYSSEPDSLVFFKVDTDPAHRNSISLKILDGPYLPASWKLCSDGKLYGFEGNAKDGFKIYVSEKNF
ncbi:MAG: hypothetical protein Kow0029_28210 [Candidatus Rifleibacteriota bacterium]